MMARRVTKPSEQTGVIEDEPQLPIHAPRRLAKKTIAGQFDPSVARAVAILAAKEGRTIGGLLGEAIGDLLQKYHQEI